MEYTVICKNCGRSRKLSYKAYWFVNSKYSKGYCKKCSPKKLNGLKKGHGWNRGLKGFRKGHKPYFIANGSSNPAWKGGITPENKKIRNSDAFIEWSKNIKERDKYECQICGGVGGKLRSNHIKTFKDFSELRLKLTNGITLCSDCDYKWVFFREQEWESYFNFNLMVRRII